MCCFYAIWNTTKTAASWGHRCMTRGRTIMIPLASYLILMRTLSTPGLHAIWLCSLSWSSQLAPLPTTTPSNCLKCRCSACSTNYWLKQTMKTAQEWWMIVTDSTWLYEISTRHLWIVGVTLLDTTNYSHVQSHIYEQVYIAMNSIKVVHNTRRVSW